MHFAKCEKGKGVGNVRRADEIYGGTLSQRRKTKESDVKKRIKMKAYLGTHVQGRDRGGGRGRERERDRGGVEKG